MYVYNTVSHDCAIMLLLGVCGGLCAQECFKGSHISQHSKAILAFNRMLA